MKQTLTCLVKVTALEKEPPVWLNGEETSMQPTLPAPSMWRATASDTIGQSVTFLLVGDALGVKLGDVVTVTLDIGS